MRWVKHLTKSRKDESLSAILEQLGAEGYGVFWLIVEIIGEVMETGKMEPSITFSELKWAQSTYVSARVWRKICKRLEEKSLIVVVSITDRLKISVPNILKYKDEYSKKSGHSPESKADRDREQIESREETPPTPSCEGPVSESKKPKPQTAMQRNFQALWEIVWLKTGPAAAFKAYEKQIKSGVSSETIFEAVRVQSPFLKAKGQYAPHPATWLNQARFLDEPAAYQARAGPNGNYGSDRKAAATEQFRQRLFREMEEKNAGA